jgi:hypothetical protein
MFQWSVKFRSRFCQPLGDLRACLDLSTEGKLRFARKLSFALMKRLLKAENPHGNLRANLAETLTEPCRDLEACEVERYGVRL